MCASRTQVKRITKGAQRQRNKTVGVPIAIYVHGYAQKIPGQALCRSLFAIEKELRKLSRRRETRPGGSAYEAKLSPILKGIPLPKQFPRSSTSRRVRSLWGWLEDIWETSPAVTRNASGQIDLGYVHSIVTDRMWASTTTKERSQWSVAQQVLEYVFETSYNLYGRRLKQLPTTNHPRPPLPPVMCDLCWRLVTRDRPSRFCKVHALCVTTGNKPAKGNRAARQAARRTLTKAQSLLPKLKNKRHVLAQLQTMRHWPGLWHVATTHYAETACWRLDPSPNFWRKYLFRLLWKQTPSSAVVFSRLERERPPPGHSDTFHNFSYAVEVYKYAYGSRGYIPASQAIDLYPDKTNDFRSWLELACKTLDDPDAFELLQYSPEDLLFMIERYYTYRALEKLHPDHLFPPRRGRPRGKTMQTVGDLIYKYCTRQEGDRQFTLRERLLRAREMIKVLIKKLIIEKPMTEKSARKCIQQYIRTNMPPELDANMILL